MKEPKRPLGGIADNSGAPMIPTKELSFISEPGKAPSFINISAGKVGSGQLIKVPQPLLPQIGCKKFERKISKEDNEKVEDEDRENRNNN